MSFEAPLGFWNPLGMAVPSQLQGMVGMVKAEPIFIGPYFLREVTHSSITEITCKLLILNYIQISQGSVSWKNINAHQWTFLWMYYLLKVPVIKTTNPGNTSTYEYQDTPLYIHTTCKSHDYATSTNVHMAYGLRPV